MRRNGKRLSWSLLAAWIIVFAIAAEEPPCPGRLVPVAVRCAEGEVYDWATRTCVADCEMDPAGEGCGPTCEPPALTSERSPLWAAVVDRDPAGVPGLKIELGTFTRFPRVDDTGAVAFQAKLRGEGTNNDNNEGVWRVSEAGLDLIQREDDAPVPGLDNASATFGAGTLMGLAGGRVLYEAAIRNVPSVISGGLWLGRDLVLLGGDPAALPWILSMGSVAAASSPDGTIGVRAVVKECADPYCDRVGTTLLAGTPDDLRPVADSGATAPGTDLPFAFDLGDFRVGAGGEIAFVSRLDVGGTTIYADTGIWRGPRGELELVVREGDPAPGTSLVFGGFSETAHDFELNAAGDVLFRGALRESETSNAWDDDTGLWLATRDGLVEVMREGAPAPCTDGHVYGDFDASDEADLNDAGAVAFSIWSGSLGTQTEHGLWLWRDGAAVPLVRRGDAAPGGGTFHYTSSPVLNDRGQVVFGAKLAAPDGHQGVWGTGTDGSLRLVLKVGEQLDLAGDGSDVRTVTGIDFNSSQNGGLAAPGNGPSGYGGDGGFNDRGEVVMLVHFDDGFMAIVVATLD